MAPLADLLPELYDTSSANVPLPLAGETGFAFTKRVWKAPWKAQSTVYHRYVSEVFPKLANKLDRMWLHGHRVFVLSLWLHGQLDEWMDQQCPRKGDTNLLAKRRRLLPREPSSELEVPAEPEVPAVPAEPEVLVVSDDTEQCSWSCPLTIYTYGEKVTNFKRQAGAGFEATVDARKVACDNRAKEHKEHCGWNYNIQQYLVDSPNLLDTLKEIHEHLQQGVRTLGLICNRGHHRSVALAALLSEALKAEYPGLQVKHMEKARWKCSTCQDCDPQQHRRERRSLHKRFQQLWEDASS